MPDRNAVLGLLGEMNERLQRLEVAFARLSPEPAISRADRAVLRVLLPALHDTFGTSRFKAADVLEEATLTTICPSKSARAIGKMFSRCSGVWASGLCLEKSGREGNAHLWKVASLGVSGFTSGYKAA